MPLNTYAGAQCTFSYDGTAIGGIVDLAPSGFSRPAVKNTAMGDTSQSYRASTQFDGGTVDVTVNYDPADAGHTKLRTDVRTAVTAAKACVITYHDGSTDTFNGFATNEVISNMTNDDTDNLQAKFTIQVVGASVFAADST